MSLTLFSIILIVLTMLSSFRKDNRFLTWGLPLSYSSIVLKEWGINSVETIFVISLIVFPIFLYSKNIGETKEGKKLVVALSGIIFLMLGLSLFGSNEAISYLSALKNSVELTEEFTKALLIIGIILLLMGLIENIKKRGAE